MQMKKLSKVLALGCCAAMVAASCVMLAGCGGSADSASGDTEYKLVNEGQLTVGSDLDFPPMEALDDNGNPTGFGVAMTQELCDRLGLEMNFLDPQNFDSLVTQVNAGETMDIAVSSITITDERAEMVAFSDPYYDSNLALVVSKGAYTDKKELNSPDVIIGVQSGSSGEDWAKENLPEATIKAFGGPTDAMTALTAGQVQGVVYDEPVAANHTGANGQFPDAEILEVIATGEQYGIAVNKDNTKLLEDINAALADMEADGTMDKIRAEYIG